MKDAEDLRSFFGGTLGFEVREEQDLGRKDLLSCVNQTSQYIENDSASYGCFFMVVMSHGNEVTPSTKFKF